MTVPHMFSILGAAGGGGPGGPALPAAILALSPVGYWKLDDASTNFDNLGSEGAAGDGANINTVTYAARSGPDGGMYPEFNPSTAEQVRCTDRSAWSIGSGLTVFACWYFDTSPTAGGHPIAAKLNFSNFYEWEVGFTSASKIRFYKCSPTFSSNRIQTTTATFSTGAWHATLVRFKGSAVTTADDVFVDSTSVEAIGTTSSGVGSASDTGADMTFGGRRDDDGTPKPRWDGSLAHVALFTGALSDSDAGDIMTAAQTDGWY
jgi:hypothetical protein